MIVVGSRCGGYNFWAKIPNIKELIWLGADETSDLDIFSNKDLPKSIFKIDWSNTEDYFQKKLVNGFPILLGVIRPYLMDGKLHIPEDKTYLCIAIRKKLKDRGINYFTKLGEMCEIFDPLGRHVTTLEFKRVI